jgi:hypothetical protein
MTDALAESHPRLEPRPGSVLTMPPELAEAYATLEQLKAVKLRHAQTYDVFGDGAVTIHAAYARPSRAAGPPA